MKISAKTDIVIVDICKSGTMPALGQTCVVFLCAMSSKNVTGVGKAACFCL